MKTRFLLHGGRLKLKDTRNDTYFQELTKKLHDGDVLLWIGFARRDETDRSEVFEREKGYILAQTNKRIEVVSATYAGFMDQLETAKVVHITGGDTPELISDIRKYPEFMNALNGKLIGGSSAGACLFSTYYFLSTTNDVQKGVGTLPIRLLVHYGNPDYKATDYALDLLRKYPEELELIVLEECEWTAREFSLDLTKATRQTIIINRPANVAFNFAINPENTPKWVEGIVTEQANEAPTRVGTIYRNQSNDGEWREFEITAFKPGVMFEMTKKDDNHHVQYTFKPLDDNKCELEYHVWTDGDKLNEVFNQTNIEKILRKLKTVVESS